MKANEIVKLDMAQYGLQENKAKEIKALYIPMINMLSEMEAEFNEIVGQKITPELGLKARNLRLRIVPIRTKADDARKSAKAEYLRANNAIQGAYNTFEWATKSKEEKLLKIEKHLELLEQERKAKLKVEREKALEKYEVETEHIQLGEMSEEVWVNYFNGVKLQYENAIAAEKKADSERIAKEKDEREEQERIRKDNERLQREAAVKEKQMQAERAKVEKEREIIEEKTRKEREALEEKARKEREEKTKLEKELQKKKDAEIKAEADKKAAQAKEERAPDKQKLIELAGRFANPKLPEVKSNEAKEILKEVAEMCNKISIFIKEKY